MGRWCHAVLLLLVVVGVVGCSKDSASNSKPKTDVSAARPSRPAPPPPPPPPSSSDVSDNAPPEKPAAQPQPVVQPASQPAAQPAPQPAAAPAPSPSPAAVAQLSIRLSTGVALAQTGPDGTMMLFSVDYEVTQGGPNASGYLWVIERAHGASAKLDVKLTAKGTLETAMTEKWRPEDGPFHSHLEDRKGNRLSESIEMLQPGT